MIPDWRQNISAYFFDKTFGPNVLHPSDFHIVGLTVKEFFSLTSHVRPPWCIVQAFLNIDTVVLIPAQHPYVISVTNVSFFI